MEHPFPEVWEGSFTRAPCSELPAAPTKAEGQGPAPWSRQRFSCGPDEEVEE